MRIVSALCLSLFTFLVLGCQNNKVMVEQEKADAATPNFSPGPPAIVYKTRADYSDKVAVTLSEDKTELVSFPHPRDIARPVGLPYPTRLADGYLLDNQGISAQAAFTSYTMEEYAALPEAPTEKEIMARIIDQDPLLHMCNCGNRNSYKNVSEAVNKFIAQALAPCRDLVDKAR